MKASCPSEDSSDPNDITTEDPNDQSTLAPNASETMILMRKLILTEDEVYTLKKKKEEILMKWTKAEDERDKLRVNQTTLLQKIEEYERLSQVLNDTIKKGDSEGVTYIREAFRLKNELQSEIRTFEKITNGYKSQVNSLNASFIAIKKEKDEYKAESKVRLEQRIKFEDKLEKLQSTKESHDIVMVVAICVLVGMLVLMITPRVYGRFAKKQTSGFNSFENSMRVKMVEVQEVGGDN